MTLRTRLIGLAATLSLLVLLAGVPVALIAMDATPIPAAIPTWEQIRTALMTPDDGTLLLTIIEVLAWGAWAVTAGSVVLEIGARLRGLRAPRLPGLHAPQLAAHQLIAAAALLFIAVPSSATPAAASPSVVAVGLHTPDHTATAYETRTHRHVQADVVERSTAVNVPTSTSGHDAQGAGDNEGVSEGGRTYVVQRGDYLALIAERELGNASRWPELVTANPALADNPDLIYSGTTLTIPTTQHGGGAGGDADVVTYVVRAGDTLSGIARTFLGDGNRYPELFTASRHTLQPGGIYLTHPDQIDIGQTITIPTSSSPNGSAATPRGQDAAPGGTDRDGTSKKTGFNGAVPRPDGGQDEGRNLPPAATPEGDVRSDAGTNVSAATSAPATASPVPSSAGARVVDPETGEPVSEGMPVAPWMLAGLTGAGALLAGGLLLRLRKAQAMRVRYRRPGRSLTNPPSTLHPVEMTMRTIGEVTAPTLEHLDSLLRRLAAARAAAGEPMPQLAAVELTPTTIVLHLSGPIELPEPWSATDDNLHWTLPASQPLDALGPEVPDKPAPYPLLVTIGVDDNEHTWLLNLENNPTTVTGDTTFAHDLIRHIALEASVGPWSRSFAVTAVGIAGELAGPERITTHPATDGTDAVAEHLAHATTMIGFAADAGADVYTARAHELGDDWPARLLIITEDHGTTPQLGELFELIEDNTGGTGTGVILHATQSSGVGMTLHVTDNGRLRLLEAELDLIAVGLTADEAEGCATVLALAETSDDAPVPVDTEATDGWPAWSDHAGALRHEHTTPRHLEQDTGTQALNGHRLPTMEQSVTPVPVTPADTAAPEPGVQVGASSLLPEPDDTYTTAAATTSQDLQTLAPPVPAEVAEQVIDADPTLDGDLAMWFHADCALPRLHLLGPVHATTRGKPLIKRKPYMTELLTFLALRRHGATRDEIAEAFNITTQRVREPVSTVREWLGTNPRTGRPHLPDARYSPSASVRGAPAYEVIDLLIDADLFRRLRLRAQARGQEGIEDLTTALSLVQGRPFEYPPSRESGGRWAWLINGERHDQHLTVAIVDVAHIVTTRALAQGDLATARQAAETARLAAPDEETPRLDLAAVTAAEGHQNEARRILRDDIYNRTDDDLPPPDVPIRTETILQNQTWLQSHGTRTAGSTDQTRTPAAAHTPAASKTDHQASNNPR